MIDRRDFIAATGATTVAATAGAPRVARAAEDSPRPQRLAAARSAAERALTSAPLIDAGRARDIMERERVDAILVTREVNVFEFTTHWPLLGRMGSPGTCFALITRRADDAIGFVIPQFTYYYIFADEAPRSNLRPFLYTGLAKGPYSGDPSASPPTGSSGTEAMPPITFRVVDEAGLSTKERGRRALLAAAGPMYASAVRALGAMLSEFGLASAFVACDDPLAEALVGQTGLATRTRPGENLLRQIRIVKSPAEIALMRYAASANAEAALAAAHAARGLGSLQAVRRRFFAEAAERGGTGVFMVVDGSPGEQFDAPLPEGSAFLIDCVSRFHNYHGDYARTVFIGEPSRRMKRATDAIAFAWSAIQEQLRPGVSYSAIRAFGQEALRRGGYDVHVGFNPHSVGLWHGDDPLRSEDYGAPRDDIALVPGMIISVDCPVFDTGIGGTAHLEDLIVVTRDGFEALNDQGHRIIVT